jgi:hypothetical protein
VRRVQHYVIKFVSDLRQVGGFLSVPSVSSTNKTDRHDITIKQTIMIEGLSKNDSLLYLYFYRGRRSQKSDIVMKFSPCKRIAVIGTTLRTKYFFNKNIINNDFQTECDGQYC